MEDKLISHAMRRLLVTKIVFRTNLNSRLLQEIDVCEQLLLDMVSFSTHADRSVIRHQLHHRNFLIIFLR